MTRFPCAHPAVIIKLEAVDDLRFMHTHIYEKLVVLSVDPDQPNAPASYTSGGDTTLTRLPPPDVRHTWSELGDTELLPLLFLLLLLLLAQTP